MVACRGGVHGCSGGGCVVAPGGGACVVAPRGGHAWLLVEGGVHGFFDEIRSMSGRYASYWNAFLFVSSVGCGGDNLDMTSLIWVIKLTFDKKYVLRP